MEKVVILKVVVSGFGEASQDLSFLTTETAKLTAEKKKLTTESRKVAETINAEKGSMEHLRAETALLRIEENKLGDATDKSGQKRKELSARIVDNTQKIRDHDRAISGSSTLVSEYEKGFSAAFGKIGGAITSVGGVIAGIYGAFKTFKEVLESTDTTADKLAATIEGVRQGFDAIKRMVATLDFKNFMENVKSAYEEGQRFAETQQSINDSTRAMKLAIDEDETAILNLRNQQKLSITTDAEKVAIGKQIQTMLETNADRRTKLAEAQLKNDIQDAAFIAKTSPEYVEAFLRQDKATLTTIEVGNKYNQLQKELATAIVNGGRLTTEADDKVITSIRNKIDAMQPEAAAYGALAEGLGSILDKQKDQIVADHAAIESAKQSAINLRVTSVTAAAEKKTEAKTIIDANDAEIESTIILMEEEKKLADERMKRATAGMSISNPWKVDEVAAAKMKQRTKDITADIGNIIDAANAGQLERERKVAAAKLQIEEKLSASKIDIANSAVNFLNAIAGKNKSIQKAVLIADKAVAIAEIVMKARVAAMATTAWGDALAGPSFGASIAAAAVINVKNRISEYLNIAEVVAATVAGLAGFAKGGRIVGGLRITPDSRGDNTLIMAKQGEAVINESQQRSIGTPTLRRAGIPGFASGGLVGGVSYSPGLGFDAKELAEMIIKGINDKQVVLNLNKLNSEQKTLDVITKTSAI